MMSEEAETCLQSKAIAAALQASTHLPTELPPALFLTDPDRTPHPEQIAGGLPQGWGMIYRHFGAEDRTLVAGRLAALCRDRGLAFLIAADPALAELTGADGVHWPHKLRDQAALWRKRFRLQTVSAHNQKELAEVQDLPVDAVILSAVFPSSSPSAGKALGVPGFHTLVSASRLPVYGLGGVTPENAAEISRFAGLAAVDGWKCFAVNASDN